jgi:micrococcal nuclease
MYEYKAKLDRVIDGDTVDCYIDLGFNITVKERVRLKGIDTPEIRTKDLEEKSKGFAAKERVEELFAGVEDFYIKTELDKKGKYGRILGTVILPSHVDISLNDILLQEGHAEIYV